MIEMLDFYSQGLPHSEAAVKVFNRADELSNQTGWGIVRASHLTLALLEDPRLGASLDGLGVNREGLAHFLRDAIDLNEVTNKPRVGLTDRARMAVYEGASYTKLFNDEYIHPFHVFAGVTISNGNTTRVALRRFGQSMDNYILSPFMIRLREESVSG